MGHMFKDKFLPNCKNLDHNRYEILSFDATKLFTSVNTTMVISEILKIIYKNPAEYFEDKDEDGRPLPNYNTFECQLGIFKATLGLR